jgi:acyl-CoA synthetase (AMP-forming)/AMP-acid ligase II
MPACQSSIYPADITHFIKNIKKEAAAMDKEHLIWQYVRKWAEETPAKEVLVFKDRRLTYKTFYEQTVSVAKLLLELGVKKGDRVFMLSAARDEAFCTYMATAMVGAIWFGLNPRYTREEFLTWSGMPNPKSGLL